MITDSGCSTMKEGAVPLGFSTGVAPAGMSACLRLLGVVMRLRRWKRSSICATRPGSRMSSRPVTSATISRVRSSCVGPMPPDVITASERSMARASTSRMRPGLSPTTVLYSRLTPSGANCWAIQAELVSTIWPSSSSEPMAMISAFTSALVLSYGSGRDDRALFDG